MDPQGYASRIPRWPWSGRSHVLVDKFDRTWVRVSTVSTNQSSIISQRLIAVASKDNLSDSIRFELRMANLNCTKQQLENVPVEKHNIVYRLDIEGNMFKYP